MPSIVKCDAETNPADEREQGMVMTEIGLAPGVTGGVHHRTNRSPARARRR